jgi:hypothetical protein
VRCVVEEVEDPARGSLDSGGWWSVPFVLNATLYERHTPMMVGHLLPGHLSRELRTVSPTLGTRTANPLN